MGTKIDEQVGGDPENYTDRRLHPVKPDDQDKAANEAASGGAAKLPAPPTPFKLNGGT